MNATCRYLFAATAILAVILSGCPAARRTASAPPSAGAKGVAQGTNTSAVPGKEPAAEPEPAPSEAAQPAADWKTYKGAWFTIQYPADFTVKPLDKSATGEGYDGVLFVYSDGKVQFYVNSPQWQGGDVGWIDMTAGEEIAESQSEKNGSKETTRVTLKGPDGKYTRAYEDTSDKTENTRLVFGFRYPDGPTRQAYHERYAKFKASLRQFAD